MKEARSFLEGKVTLHPGDCLDVLRTLPDASIDSVVTDPPYALVSISRRFGKAGAKPPKAGDAYARASAGFMGKQWDTGERAFAVEFWAEVLRVLKPGGHCVAFSGSRTYHRMACAIEDAGFEIRDQLMWLYGSGFPKSHDVSKGIDKAQTGVVRGRAGRAGRAGQSFGQEYERNPKGEPITAGGEKWSGWGTALKPAHEPIVLARKPLDGTVAANVLLHGTGAINVDGCRVATHDALGGGGERAESAAGFTNDGWRRPWMDGAEALEASAARSRASVAKSEALGRWPANVVHDGSDEVVGAFPETGAAKSGNRGIDLGIQGGNFAAGVAAGRRAKFTGHDDAGGSAARFFYSAKADADDRLGSKHPTVKPVDLMQWLCRLVTPPGGLVLDPFAGTGTTGEAAFREGFRAVLIEREAEYRADIARRMALAVAGPAERKRASAKPFSVEGLALFGGGAEQAEGGGRIVYGSFARDRAGPSDRSE